MQKMSMVCATNYYICIRWWIIWWSLLQTRFDDDLCYELLQTTNFRCFSCYMMIFATNYYICIRWWIINYLLVIWLLNAKDERGLCYKLLHMYSWWIINYLLGNIWWRKGIRYVRLLWRPARPVRQKFPCWW